MLTERDLDPRGDAGRVLAWDSVAERPVPYDTTAGPVRGDATNPALEGEYRIVRPRGDVLCHPAFELYRRLCRRYPPGTIEETWWIPRAQVEEAARLICGER